MKNKLTFALLFAGLFLSGNAYANNCAALTGQLQPFTQPAGTGCATTNQYHDGPTQCCDMTLIGSGGDSGNPNDEVCVYQYTGTSCANPDPIDPPEPPPPLELPEWSEETPSTVDRSNYYNNTYASLKNMTERLNSITSYLSNDSFATQGAIAQRSLETQNYIYQQSRAVRSSLGNQISNVDHKVQTIMNRQVRLSDMENLFGDVKTDVTEIKEAQAEGQAQLESLIVESTSDLPQMAIGIENARYHAQVAANRAENAEISARESISASQNAEQASYETYELAYESREDIREIYNRTYENIETLSSIQSATSELFGLRDLIRSDTRASAQDAAVSTQDTVWQSNDQIMSYMGSLNQSQATALSDIKSAIQDIDSGTGGGPTADTGTHERLDTLNAKTSELNQNVVDSALNTQQAISGSTDELLAELTAIKDALENGSSEYDDTEVNQKLTELINNTGTTGTNVVTSGQATQQAVSASGQQVTDAVNGLGDKLDGIGEGIDSLSDSLKPGTGQKASPTLCTGDDCYKGKSWVTPKYPEGISSIYEDHKTKFQDSTVHEYLKGFKPDLSGSAPDHWEFCINFDGMANLGCHTVELPPYVISFVRLIILISAGFLCRRLIFGG